MSERVRACTALLLCCLGALASLAAQDSRPAVSAMPQLERLGRDALAIVVVKVDQRFRALQTSPAHSRQEKGAPPEFAEGRCSIERVLYGRAELAGTMLRATVRGAQVPELLLLRKDDSLVLFLQSDPIVDLSEAARRDLHDLPVDVLVDGAWPVKRVGDAERVFAPASALPIPEPLTSNSERQPKLPSLCEWLDALIARTTPSIRTEVSSTSPIPYYRRLDRDGLRKSSDAPRELWIERQTCDAIFARWEALKIGALPESFVEATGPCEAIYELLEKGRGCVRRIRFHVPSPSTALGTTERDQLSKAQAAMELLRTL